MSIDLDRVVLTVPSVGQADGTFVITKNGGGRLGITNVAGGGALKTRGTHMAASGTKFIASCRGNSNGNAGGAYRGVNASRRVSGVRAVVSKSVMGLQIWIRIGEGAF
jgi:hypothetical protein